MDLIPKPYHWKHYTHHIGRILLAALFLWAGVHKAMSPELFLQDIESFQLLPYRWAWLLSIWLPFLEITAATALLTTRKWVHTGALTIGLLLITFLIAIISAWARGLPLSCGCFGSSFEPVNYPWLVSRDLLLLGLAGVTLKTTNLSIKEIKDTKFHESKSA